MSEVEEIAVAAVAKACASAPQQRAIAAALIRVAGDALAKLASPADAEREHTKCAAQMRIRMCRTMPLGRRR